MTPKFPSFNLVVLFAAAALVAAGATAASAQSKPRYDKDGRPYYGAAGPNRSYQQGPNTRVYVTTRSWLDAGTEVLPGDRKFQDYAFPSPYGYPSFARENNNRPIDRQPLSTPSDVAVSRGSFRCIDGFSFRGKPALPGIFDLRVQLSRIASPLMTRNNARIASWLVVIE